MDPDMDVLQDYLSEKIGWNKEKFKSVVVPVLEKFKTKEVLDIVKIHIDTNSTIKFFLVSDQDRFLLLHQVSIENSFWHEQKSDERYSQSRFWC